MIGQMPGDRPRSLTEDLRARDDDALASMLLARPDLLNPVPADLVSLAARATTRSSVQRALDQLDQFTVQVVEVICALSDPLRREDVRRLLGADPDRPLATLHAAGLVFGADDDGDQLFVVRAVREIVGAPAGLGPPAEEALRSYGPARLERLLTDLGLGPTGDPVAAAAEVAARLADRSWVDGLLADAPAEARDALATMTWGPAVGRLGRAHREVDTDTARTPVEWLLARGLLVAADGDTVVLPREVGLHLRGGRVHERPIPEPPALELVRRAAGDVDRTAAAAALDAVRLVEDLLELWGNDPPRILRAGGLGVRDRTRTASALEVDEHLLALLVETAHAGGLVSAAEEPDEVWLPTTAYDRWLGKAPADRWLDLVDAWLPTTRVAGLAGRRDDRDRVLAPLGPGLDRIAAPQVRKTVLDAVAAVADAAPTAESLVARLRWHAPRRSPHLRDDLVGWTLREAEALGVTGRGAMPAPGRLLLAGDASGATRLMATLLPAPLDQVLLQADLTAVAPGPLAAELARLLRLLADVESTGGATVYRFSPHSVRRALDAGWTAAELLDLLGRHSSTPVPQPLTYLVEDVARRHGRIRVGAASSYVRCDDGATLSEIVADKRAASLRLRRLTDTVLAADATAETVLARLREMGFAPAAEGPAGDVVVRRPDARRATTLRRPPRLVAEQTSPRPAMLAAAVRALRVGDRALAGARSGGGDAGRSGRPLRRPTVDILAMLSQAAVGRTPLYIGYVSAEGHASNRVIEPISVDGGYVSAFDHLRDEVRTFAVHRITGVSEVDEPVS